MTKAELIERIARSRDLPPEVAKKDIAKILGIAFDEIASYFARTKATRTSIPRFTFPRFGTFTKKRRSARMGVNPRTLEPMQIEAFNTLDFKASRELREAMNGPAAKPEVATRPRRTQARAGKASAPRIDGAPAPAHATRRRLTPRDEEAELDAMIPDEALFAEEPALPAPRMQRVDGGDVEAPRARARRAP